MKNKFRKKAWVLTVVQTFILVVLSGCPKKEEVKKAEPFGIQVQVSEDLKLQGAVQIVPSTLPSKAAPVISKWVVDSTKDCVSVTKNKNVLNRPVSFQFKWKEGKLENITPMKTQIQTCMAKNMSSVTEDMKTLLGSTSRDVQLQIINADFY